jgi:hypothetical protein
MVHLELENNEGEGEEGEDDVVELGWVVIDVSASTCSLLMILLLGLVVASLPSLTT